MLDMSTTTAIRAESFMQSIGVNTHIGRAGTPYTSISLIEQELSYLGIDRCPRLSTASFHYVGL